MNETRFMADGSPTPASQAPFNRLKDCRYGRMLYNVNDMYVGRSLDLYGQFSEAEVEVFRQIVRPGDVVLDAGANIGAHTVFFARATEPKGAVFAFEPQRLVFQLLCANVALNDFIHVWCYPCALGEKPGTILVPTLRPDRENNFGGLSLEGRTRGEPVQVIRADSLPIASCRLIKIDVEGMELSALKGCTGLIERFGPALYVENDRAEHSTELIRFIDSLGYDQFWHLPPLYDPNNFLRNPANVFGDIVSRNMLCLRRGTYTGNLPLPRVDVPRP